MSIVVKNLEDIKIAKVVNKLKGIKGIKGNLILVPCKVNESIFGLTSVNQLVLTKDTIGSQIKIWYKPIIVSKTEKIEYNEFCFDLNELIITKKLRYNENTYHDKYCKKILALPEHFSSKQLQDIITGKLKNDDTVYLECEEAGGKRQDSMNGCFISKTIIKLNFYKHIILYHLDSPMYTEEEVLKLTENAYDSGRYAIINKDIDNTYDNWKLKNIK